MDLWTAFTIVATAIGIAASISTRKVLVARAQARGTLDAQTVLARLEALDARLARLEQAVEANGIEIERIGEAQRFLTQVSAEAAGRSPLLPANGAGGAIRLTAADSERV